MTDGLIALSVLAWLAYATSRLLARRKVPELVGFLLVGAALGPSGAELIDAGELASLAPVTQIALGMLMFLIGDRVSLRALRASRWAASAGIVQYVLAGGAVYATSRALGADQSTSLLLATLAGAGAPLTVAAVVTSAKASGRYVEGLISTHAVCDALAATAFAAVLPVAILIADDEATRSSAMANFVRLGVGGIALGLAFGWFVARFGPQIETSGELLLFVLVHLLLGWAVADSLDISLPLAALVAGAVASTRSPEEFSARTFRTVRTIEQPLYLLFFALAGASIHLEDVPEVGAVGVAYLVVRVLTKVTGGVIGGLSGGLGWRDGLRLGADSVPQAGVAVGLAVLAGEVLEGPGTDAATVVLGSVVVFELIGPLVVARGLRTGARSLDEPAVPADAVLVAPEVVLVASQRPVVVPDWLLEQCERWGASMVALLPRPDELADRSDLSVRAARLGVSLELRRWVPGESFTGTVLRLCEEVGAGLVVVPARPPSAVGSGSRLVLLPHERIARQVRCPVMLLPAPRTAGAAAPDDPPRRVSLRQRVRAR